MLKKVKELNDKIQEIEEKCDKEMATTEEKCFQEMATVEQKIQFLVETELNQNASEFNVASMATSLSTPPEAKCFTFFNINTCSN